METKFIPILMQTEMVEAYMNNTKNQTRRLRGLDFFNENPDRYRYDGNEQTNELEPSDKNFHWFEFVGSDGKPMEAYKSVKCPFGKDGDILWIRETFCGLIQSDNSVNYIYKAGVNNNFGNSLNPFWTPSIHMPKKACRHFAKITNIKIERLHDITESDAIFEGIKRARWGNGWHHYSNPENFIPFHFNDAARICFGSLWISINGEENFDSNPWVWVIKFERIDKPNNFI